MKSDGWNLFRICNHQQQQDPERHSRRLTHLLQSETKMVSHRNHSGHLAGAKFGIL
jgi:hypothetical protein